MADADVLLIETMAHVQTNIKGIYKYKSLVGFNKIISSGKIIGDYAC